MQNDPLYNKIMKKILIIEITYDTPEGESDPVTTVTHFNMAPDEVLASGNLPLIGFYVLNYKDESYTEYGGFSYFRVKDDRTEVSIFTIDGPQIVADIENNTWKVPND